MKQFLYLDTDIVNSIIAQSEQGLITQFSNESETGTNKSKELSVELQGKANTNASFFKLAKAEVEGSLGIGFDATRSNHDTYREIANKTLHDAAFDFAYEYIEPKEYLLGATNSDEYGDYIKLNRVFDFVDLSYLERIFSKEGLLDYLKKDAKKKIDDQVQEAEASLTKEQLKATKKVIKEKALQIIKSLNQEYDDIHDILTMYSSLLPYSRMLISTDGYLIPLEDKYFRINPTNLGFKYGGDITCVGVITNIIGEDTNPEDEKNIFATLQFNVNEMLRAILPTKEKNICVVHPIAVYYEN